VVWGCSGISWTIHKQSAPRSRQIATQTPHQSIFTGHIPFLTPDQQCQSTEGSLLQTEWHGISVYVCSVCTTVSREEMAEEIEMPFGGGANLHGPRQPCIGWECTLAPGGEYDGSVCVVVAMRPVVIINVATCILCLLLALQYIAACILLFWR